MTTTELLSMCMVTHIAAALAKARPALLLMFEYNAAVWLHFISYVTILLPLPYFASNTAKSVHYSSFYLLPLTPSLRVEHYSVDRAPGGWTGGPS